MRCTAGLGAKEVRREGSGGGGRKVTRRVRVLHRLIAAHSCAPGEELFSLQDSNAVAGRQFHLDKFRGSPRDGPKSG